MVRGCSRGWLLTLCLLPISSALAQNVTNYASMPDPYLLLLREPAVLDELRLTREQRQAIDELNAALDGPLLASRNQPPEKQGEQVALDQRDAGENRQHPRRATN